MGVEVATYINDLVATNPPSTDDVAEGDNHLQLIKAVLKTQFPGASRPWPIPTAVTKSVDYVIVAADQNKTILFDVSGGDKTATLPTLTGGDAGWECHIVKNEASSLNGVKVVPASGTITSQDNAFASIRVGQPFTRTRLFWTGSVWLCDKTGPRIGSIEIFQGAGLPRGYAWCDGASFSGTAFAELAGILGGTVIVDLRGRVVAGADNMGGSAANRLTSAGSGINGSSIGSVGGAQNVTLAINQMPAHGHTFTTGNESGNHQHSVALPTVPTTTSATAATGSGQTGLWQGTAGGGSANTGSQSVNHTHSGTTDNAGGATAVIVCQPTMVLNMIIRMC